MDGWLGGLVSPIVDGIGRWMGTEGSIKNDSQLFVGALEVDDANGGTMEVRDVERKPRVQNDNVTFASFFGDRFFCLFNVLVHSLMVAVEKGRFEVGFRGIGIAKGWYTRGKNALQITEDGGVDGMLERSQGVSNIAVSVRVHTTYPPDHRSCIKVEVEETRRHHLGQLWEEARVWKALMGVAAERGEINVGVVP